MNKQNSLHNYKALTFIFLILTLASSVFAAAPIISNPGPANGATAVNFNSPLSVSIDDADGDLLNITFSLYNGSQWLTQSDLRQVSSGLYSANTTGWTVKALTGYTWNVTVNDGTGNVVQQSFSFTTKNYQNVASLKWRTLLPNAEAGQMAPVMGDVDNDGVQEIVVASGVQLTVLNGNTGAIEWTRPLDMLDTSAAELADLNQDGVPEILAIAKGPDSNDAGSALDLYLKAFDGQGNEVWTSDSIGGDASSMYPITSADIDGDGYPEIYTTTEDTFPTIFSGNMNDYLGRISKIDHNGNVLAQQPTYHPCWGGVSLADTNFDGKFEIYVGDRRGPYNGGYPSKGPHSYDAETLELLWSRPDIQSSSPMVVIADVTGDSELEAVTSPITLRGPLVIDPQVISNQNQSIPDVFSVTTQAEANAYLNALPKGVSIPGMDYAFANNKRLPTHGTPTVYDINGDGNMDIIYSTAYPDNAPTNFTVFDLVTGQRLFDTRMDVPANWPPRMGDISGDTRPEILVSTGYQGSGKVYQLHVYDADFNLITSMNIASLGQLITALVMDTDGDGLNELVLTGVKGIAVYDTSALAPAIKPNTWNQLYSPYRQGVSTYVVPPGQKEPLIRDALPSNSSVDVALGPVLSARVHDFQFKQMDVVFEVNDGNGWQVVSAQNNVSNGVLTAATLGTVTQGNYTYDWRVTATDADGFVGQKQFTFTTVVANNSGNESGNETTNTTSPLDAWNFKRDVTVDNTKVISDISDFPMLVVANVNPANAQDDGDDFVFTNGSEDGILAHEIESYNSATGDLVAWVKVPSLSSSQATVLNLYYGNDAVSSQENPDAVWDSNFLAVHHMDEASGTVVDSKANADGNALNGVNQSAAGKIGNAYGFDGINDRVQLTQVLNGQSQFTFEAWYNTANKHGYIISQRDNSSQGAFMQYFPTEGTIQFYTNNRIMKRATSTGTWHYIAGTYDGSTANLYVNNNVPVAAFGAIVTWPNQATFLGDRSNLGRAMQGSLDEVRISNIARPEGYLRTSYENQNNPSTFAVVGPEVAN